MPSNGIGIKNERCEKSRNSYDANRGKAKEIITKSIVRKQNKPLNQHAYIYLQSRKR